MSFDRGRRRFLRASLGLLAALAVPRATRGPGGALARAYAEATPREARPERLAELLARRLGGPPASAPASVWGAAIREDFATGDVVCLHGWILSRTECRRALWRALA